jgi:hypothetical protein
MTVDGLVAHLKTHWSAIRASLVEGTYEPGFRRGSSCAGAAARFTGVGGGSRGEEWLDGGRGRRKVGVLTSDLSRERHHPSA